MILTNFLFGFKIILCYWIQEVILTGAWLQTWRNKSMHQKCHYQTCGREIKWVQAHNIKLLCNSQFCDKLKRGFRKLNVVARIQI